jgi:hypothetical protein
LNPPRCNVAALLCSGGTLLLLCFYTPGTGLPVCGFHWLTSWPCPLCGLTRGLFQLAKGHWQAAIAYHALSPLVFLALVGSLLANLWPPLKQIPCPAALRERAWVICAGLFVGYGVGRAFL